MLNIKLASFILTMFLYIYPLNVIAQDIPGIPFEQLQEKVLSLETQVSTLQTRTSTLQATINELLQCFQIDSSMAAVSIECDVQMMKNAMVMGATELEGDTMMKKKATVMGEAHLEGDAKMMQKAMVMGAPL